jgi:ubiquinone/menaquinone biosynthesis C-methylase UbiE
MTTLDSDSIHSTRRERYVLDNAAPQALARFAALSELYDETSMRHLQRIGVTRGWQCWEIGAGHGSIAAWLCGQVGPSGSVLATDIDTRYLDLSAHANLAVRTHDIASDPLPDTRFDLIHARLVLVHLPARLTVLDRMVAALKPGGWLLTEEFDSFSQLPAPDRYPGEVALKTTAALRGVMMQHGVEPGFGRALAGELRARNLENVSAEGRMQMSLGGSAGAALMKVNFAQLREPILASGAVTPAEFEADFARLDQADFMAPSQVMWSVAGRRPAG